MFMDIYYLAQKSHESQIYNFWCFIMLKFAAINHSLRFMAKAAWVYVL